MNDELKHLLKPIASLKLTVALLAASMLVIFAGTLAQRDAGIWQVQHQLFQSWVCRISLHDLFFSHIRGWIPFIGGKTLIVLLLVNLLAAHLVRFKVRWNRVGVIMIHLGLILLLVGELITTQFATEGQITLNRGERFNYTQDIRAYELAITDPSPADHENVTVIPGRLLARPDSQLSDDRLPFQLKVVDYYPNSQLLGPMQEGAPADRRVDRGTEVGRRIVPIPVFSGAGPDADKVDAPAAIVTLLRDGKPLGTWSFSMWARGPQQVRLPDGRSYNVELRFKRVYKPYTVQLLKFTHETYAGSTLDRNFASRLRLVDPSRGVDREVLIWMNHPLRYAGETFYQQSFGPDGRGSEFTQIQVVHNPGWLIPYAALAISMIGLVVQFGGHLVGFLRRQRHAFGQALPAGGFAVAPVVADRSKPGNGRNPAARNDAAPAPRINWAEWLLPVGVMVVGALCILSAAQPTRNESGSGSFDIAGFARLPVSYEGRVMPMDTLARTALKVLHSSESVKLDGKSVAPGKWLLDVLADQSSAEKYETFRIDNPDVLNAVGLDPSRKYYSWADLIGDKERKEKLGPQIKAAFDAEQEHRLESSDLATRKFYELGQHVMLYNRLNSLQGLYLIPPQGAGDDWHPVGEMVKLAKQTGEPASDLRSLMILLSAYQQNDPATFNSTVDAELSRDSQRLAAQRKVDYEAYFNHFDPFFLCMIFYVVVFLLAVGSWLIWQRPLGKSAFWLLGLAFMLHTFALVSRIYISGRPPVTNLYSSAIFIAWGAVALAMGLEFIYRNGIGSAMGATIGFCSLLIAQSLAMEGDTMAQLRAVLDTNFWLATHVVVITLGYASTFLAGKIALAYIMLGLFTPLLASQDVRKTLARMIYGIVCFALLFSFVGTILGGIWADQSWGRFWGWDPKENGAILIVLWNAIILHARWGGLVRDRGVAVLAVVGNIVTSWSWFGTNMLGVGLHSYGFMDKAFPLLIGYDLSQAAFVAMGALVPMQAWVSFAPKPGMIEASPPPNVVIAGS